MSPVTFRRSALTIVAGLAVVLQCFLPAQARAAETAKGPNALPLATFMGANERIRLRYTADEFTISVPLAARFKVSSARLHLQLTNSISLLKDRSQVAVRLNGRLLGQTALSPQQPESSLDIRIPPNVLKPGYNQLTFAVAQHYTLRCEDPSAPELWTEIDTVASTLTIDGEAQAVTPRLSDMSLLFDPKVWGDQTFTIVTASPPPVKDDQLQWGALVARGAALHLRYAPLRVVHEPAGRTGAAAGAPAANFPGLQQDSLRRTDSALIGTRAELAPYVSKKISDGITGSFLGVYALDADPTRFVLVVSGTTAAEVAQAATAFTHMNFPFPDSASMLVTRIDYPGLANYSGKNTVAPGGSYRFSQFDFKSKTVQGAATSSLINEEHVHGLEIELVMPADLFAHEDSNVDLILHFAYGAALRKDSVLNILLNDRFERAIGLTVEAGVVYNKYQVSIPLRSFQPGVNRLRFMPRMMPLITGECQAIQSENLILTMYEDSLVVMPGASHFVTMPNLRLLGRSGFPYTVQPNSAGMLVHVAAADSKTVAAAWTLLAKLAQRHGQPLQEAVISFALPQSADKDLLVIGAAGQIQAGILKGAPLELGKLSRVPYPVAAETPAQDNAGGWLAWFLPGRARALEVAAAEGDEGKAVMVTQASTLTSSAVAMQYRSPYASERTATVFTAADQNLLLEGIGEMIKPAVWNELQGNLVVWSRGVENVAWQKVGGDYTIGNVSVPARMEFYFSRYPWVWLIALVLIAALLASITIQILKRFRRTHHPEAPARRDND